LPLVVTRPDLRWVLVDASERRCRWLESAAQALGAGGRVEVRHERAELTGRGSLREMADAVVARLFGRPAVTVECASPLVAVGGSVWVAEPPQRPERWPAPVLSTLGLLAGEMSGGWRRLDKVQGCSDRFPRRTGIPAKRPLF
jgi:16S rRNA (guanine527-N7)-methyltransferase